MLQEKFKIYRISSNLKTKSEPKSTPDFSKSQTKKNRNFAT